MLHALIVKKTHQKMR